MNILSIILISSAISIIITIVFRMFDKSNQQLSKLKLFVEKSMKELDAFIVEKKQVIKDLTIDVDFLIKQAQAIASKYEKQNDDILLFFSKFNDQKQEIEQLKKSIAKLIETREAVSQDIIRLQNVNNKIEQFKKELVKVEEQCNSLNDSLLSKQESMREQVESYLLELHEKANQVIQQNAKSQYEKLKLIELDLNKKIEEIQQYFEKKSEEIKRSFEITIFESEDKIKENLSLINEKISDFKEIISSFENQLYQIEKEKENEFEKSISEILSNNQMRLEEKVKSLESLRNNINLLYIQLEEKVDLFSDTLETESNKMLDKFNESLIKSFSEKTKKIEEYLIQSEKQLSQVTQKIENIQDAVDKIIKAKASDIGKYVFHLEQRIANYQETVFKEIEKRFTTLDLDARAIVEQYKNDITIFNTKSFEDFESKIEFITNQVCQIENQQKLLNEHYINGFDNALTQLNEKINNSIENLKNSSENKIVEISKNIDSK